MLGRRKSRPIFHEIDRETVLKINRRPNRCDLSWPPPPSTSQISKDENSILKRNSSSCENLLTREWPPSSSKFDVYKKFYFPKDKFYSSENGLDKSDILCNLTNLDRIQSNEVISNNDTSCKVKLPQQENKIYGRNLISYKTILLDDDSKVIENKNQRRFSSCENIFLTTNYVENYDKSISENIQKINEYMNLSNKIVQELINYESGIALNDQTFNDLLNFLRRKHRPIAYLNDDKFIEFLIKNKDIKNEYYDPEYFNENFSDDLKHFETVKETNKFLSNYLLEHKKNQNFIELLPKKKVTFSLPSSPFIEVVDSNYNKITRQHSLDSQKFSGFMTDQFQPVEGIYPSIKTNPLIPNISSNPSFYVFFHIFSVNKITFNLFVKLTEFFCLRNFGKLTNFFFTE